MHEQPEEPLAASTGTEAAPLPTVAMAHAAAIQLAAAKTGAPAALQPAAKAGGTAAALLPAAPARAYPGSCAFRGGRPAGAGSYGSAGAACNRPWQPCPSMPPLTACLPLLAQQLRPPLQLL